MRKLDAEIKVTDRYLVEKKKFDSFKKVGFGLGSLLKQDTMT
jgi:hypothetical protein